MIVLKALRVRSWRGLDRVAIADLSPGLNVVEGPNEAGKSRLFEALHHGFFERHRGQSRARRELQSWHLTDPPVVEVDFDVAGVPWTLRKQFLRGEHARLQGPGELLHDDDAERRLAELLGTAPGSGPAKPADQGIWPLLWLPQGHALATPDADLTEHARTRLGEILAAEIDEVAAGTRGQQIQARVDAEFDRYFTPTGLPGRDTRALRVAVEQARGEVATAEARREEARRTADELGEADRRANELAVARQAARARLDAATAASAALDGLRHRLRTARAELAEATTRATLCAHTQRTHASARTVLEQARAALDQAGAACAEARHVADQRRAASADAVRDLAEARRTARQSQAVLAAELGLSRDRLRVLPDAARMRAIREAARRAQVTAARRDASSLTLRLRAERDLVANGDPLVAGDVREWAVADLLVVEVPGMARVEVQGPAHAVDAAIAARDAAQDLADALGDLPDLAEAEAAWEERLRLEPRCTSLAAQLADPDGGSEAELTARLAASASAEAERAVELAERRLEAAREGYALAVAASAAVDPTWGSEAPAARAEADRQAAHALVATLDAELTALGATAVEGEVDAATRAHQALVAQHEAATRARVALGARLDLLGAGGPHEAVVEAEATLHELERELAAWERSARAVAHLRQTLADARRRAQGRLLGPVAGRMTPWLGELFPSSQLDIDEAWAIRGLRSAGVPEPFHLLSGGAREQLSVLVRVGLAGVLGGGERVPVVLDDALVNSDPGRRATMLAVLARAATDVQVIWFTSDPGVALPDAARRFRLAGAPAARTRTADR